MKFNGFIYLLSPYAFRRAVIFSILQKLPKINQFSFFLPFKHQLQSPHDYYPFLSNLNCNSQFVSSRKNLDTFFFSSLSYTEGFLRAAHTSFFLYSFFSFFSTSFYPRHLVVSALLIFSSRLFYFFLISFKIELRSQIFMRMNFQKTCWGRQGDTSDSLLFYTAAVIDINGDLSKISD